MPPARSTRRDRARPRGSPPLARGYRALSPEQRRRAWLLAGIVLALHVIGLALLITALPHEYRLGSGGVFGVGLAITAYTLGVRHAFDADHIAAIDTTTRKLIGDGQRPLSVGFFFSLGHSSVVLLLMLVVVLGVRGVGRALTDDGSTLHQVTGVAGPLIAGSFLLLIGLLNLGVLVGLVRVLRSRRHGALEDQLGQRGLLNRLYGRATRAVRAPWQMYPLGVLFGLGFDTASEVALLVLAGSGAAGQIPVYALLALPVLFAAGMSLFDTLDGAFMTFAYGWSSANPVRRLFYNLTVTGLSVAVALLVGLVELLSVLADELRLTGGVWDVVSRLDFSVVGFAIVGLFAGTWAIAVAVWRFGRIEERWSR